MSCMIQAADLGICVECVESYVPSVLQPIEDLVVKEGSDPSLECIASRWHDILVEPELFFAYFREQMCVRSPSGSGLACEPAVGPESLAAESVHCAADESNSEMALRVGRQLLERNPHLAQAAQLLIHSHSTLDDNPTWSTACRLQHELGLRNAVSFSISQKGGNSTLAAVGVASSMMMAEPGLNTVIVIASEKVIQPCRRLLYGPTVLNDGAGALVLRRPGKGLQLLGLHIRDFPELWTPGGHGTDGEDKFVLWMAKQSRIVLEDLLHGLGLRLPQVSLIIPPSFNRALVYQLAEELNMPLRRMQTSDLGSCHNMGSASFMIYLQRAIRCHNLQPNDLIVVLGMGFGLSLGCVILSCL